MAGKTEVDLAVITFAHNRARRLDAALRQILEEVPAKTGLSTRAVIMPDRPLRTVGRVVARWKARTLNAVTCYPSLPILSPEHGQQWCRARNEGLEEIDRHWRPRWVCDWNDEWLLGPGWEEHLHTCLNAELPVNAWNATSLFLWDEEGTQVNVRQRHWSPLFGRHRPGWRRDPTMTNQIAQEIEGRGAHLDLPFYLLDFGTTTDAERERVYRACANAGKVDDYTRRFVEPPILQPLQLVLSAYPNPADYHNMQLLCYG